MKSKKTIKNYSNLHKENKTITIPNLKRASSVIESSEPNLKGVIAFIKKKKKKKYIKF